VTLLRPYLYFQAYFVAGVCAGFGAAGAEFVCRRFNSGRLDAPDCRVATMDREIDVIMKTIAEIVVAFESKVAEPRGPNAVCEPCPPKAPAKSAALPLCSSTTMIRKRHTTT